jgi:hypothetical protein
MQIERIMGKWQLIGLPFAQAAVADGQSAVALYTAEDAGHVLLNTSYTMPFAGEIIGVSANLDTAGTVGDLILTPTIAGTVTTDPALTITTLAYGKDTCSRGTNMFAAGALVGCKLTSENSWNGTSSDLQVIVWVILKVEGV